MTSSKSIRDQFLAYFEGLDHVILPSSSLIPKDDPTLLFSNAGMNQFKPIFLGTQSAPHHSVATCQKCLRISGKHNDLENIGYTRRHHTFFEMLGNFSFGGYFKEHAIEYAWRFVLDSLNLDKERIVVTYYKEDTETAKLWRKITGFNSDRIIPLGKEDNFWSMGETGPCGPCSEIHYYMGSLDHVNEPNLFANRQSEFLEIWNLVFMEFNKTESGLEPLSKKCIDTGMGLERVCSIVQNASSNFETDLFKPIIEVIEEASGVRYEPTGFDDQSEKDSASGKINTAFRIVADHSRAVTFLISEGLLPGSDERQYVLRKLIRRATLFSNKISPKKLLPAACEAVVRIFKDVYPEVERSAELVKTVVNAEVDRFNEIIEDGIRYLKENISGSVVTGETAFVLHDTYGFPIEVTRDVARDLGFVVDEAGFEKHMLEQRARSKSASKSVYIGIKSVSSQSEFVGYDNLEVDATILGVQRFGKDTWAITTDITPFYPESGGQVGDKGELIVDDNVFAVQDTQKIETGIIVHRVQASTDLEKFLGSKARLKVDPEFRRGCCRAHSATHIIHHALRTVLGPETKQAGSRVEPDRLRFDFTCFEEILPQTVQQIENVVLDMTYSNRETETFYTTLEEALKLGALAFFGDKYQSDRVRVVKIGDSIELCGGTHVRTSAEPLPIRILKIHSVSTGIKRIEALVGKAALKNLHEIVDERNEALAYLKSKDGLAAAVKRLRDEFEAREAWVNQIEDKLVSLLVASGSKQMLEGANAVVFQIDDHLAPLAEKICDQLKVKFDKICYVVVKAQPNTSLVVGTNSPSLSAQDHLKKVLAAVGGRGGGSKRFAKGSVPSVKLDELINLVVTT